MLVSEDSDVPRAAEITRQLAPADRALDRSCCGRSMTMYLTEIGAWTALTTLAPHFSDIRARRGNGSTRVAVVAEQMIDIVLDDVGASHQIGLGTRRRVCSKT